MSPSTSRPPLAKSARFTVLTALLCGALSCSDPGTMTGGTGGNGSGGTTGTGGVTSTGGSTGTGGETAAGGSTGTGGKGGTTSTGGTTGSGGTGGTTSTGGATGTGGIGGKPGTGGTGTGGTTGTGGAAGKPGTGGTGTGGTSTGGTTGTGGTTSTGGSSGNANPSGLPLPPGAGGMAKPSGTPSTITVLNWAGFKGAVSYTLDDDNSSQISNYSMLQAQGIPYTFYIWGNKTEATNAIWAQAVKDGSEIGNHTWSHSSTPPGGAADITQDTTFIMQHLSVTPYTMAAPNGASVYTQLANGLFMINRGVADAIIKPSDSTDRFTLPCYIPATGAPASSFNSEVDSAQSAGGWRVILVHGFTGGTDGAYQPVGISDYIAGIQHTKSLGNMWIGTVEDVGAYWLGQKAFGSATTTTSGSNKTWTWTKPSNFAPGKYLRVTVAGGTLTQGGQALPWNDHGYYEIALDAGSVTLGP